MNKLRQSFRRKKDVYIPEASRPHQWQTDEEGVRTGKCSFPVKYLGHVEVDESRGMHICEDAVKRLKALMTLPPTALKKIESGENSRVPLLHLLTYLHPCPYALFSLLLKGYTCCWLRPLL
uniref:NUMB endocytic adaptor protein n=1 Tax=Molossus molossus TaxID=27622 RepID=A0A7J8JXQ9_MOLMO|nr:NUMB endocytic adaptor protein [Molossus molossus]